jgi:glutathione S-transferase
MRSLVCLSYSPWSEKARWALDHHGLEYRRVEYVPIIGEPLLRLRARKPFGRITVPILFDDGEVLDDSFDIARHADRVGRGSRLFPEGRLEEIRGWNERSERALAAGRALTANRTALDPVAKLESVPPFVPEALRPKSEPLVDLGIRYLRRKYGFDEGGTEALQETIVRSLDALRSALAGRATVLPEGFSYADVVMAVSLQFVRPPEDRYIRLGAASRVCWTDPALAPRYADLLDWRDDVYGRFRERS